VEHDSVATVPWALTRQEYAKAMRYLAARDRWWWAMLAVCLAVIAIGVAISALVAFVGVALAAWVGSAYYAPVLLTWAGKSSMNDTLPRAKFPRPARTMTATDDAVDFASSGRAIRYDWSHLPRLHCVDHDLFLLETGPHAKRLGIIPCTQAFIVPRRAFASVEDAERFRELAERQTGQ
jgi:hypothetical protein